MSTTNSITKGSFRFRSLLGAVPVVAVAAAVTNAVVFLIADSLGAMPASVIIPASGQGLNLPSVVFISIVAVIFAGIVLALLARFTRNPHRIFYIVAAVVLVLSFASPLSLPNAPLNMVVFLELMHILTAAWCVALLPRFVTSPSN